MTREDPLLERIEKVIANATHLERIDFGKSPEKVLEMPKQFGSNRSNAKSRNRS